MPEADTPPQKKSHEPKLVRGYFDVWRHQRVARAGIEPATFRFSVDDSRHAVTDPENGE